MRMSDLVAQYIIEMLDRENGSAEIQRNELAVKSCMCTEPNQLCYNLPIHSRKRLHCREP